MIGGQVEVEWEIHSFIGEHPIISESFSYPAMGTTQSLRSISN